MLTFPANLTAEDFLSGYWQKTPLFMPNAIEAIRPAMSRNELAWLATLADVESRIVFTNRAAQRRQYSVENGPFDAAYLEALPKRDWSLLVHDVEKHVPTMRKWFAFVPFVPDWRIDDLMISFAVPGGGVGPHRDNYDVFLCQGIGIREWRVSSAHIDADRNASDDLVLLRNFEGEECHTARCGDVLYLPPGVAHWGTAQRACITYSIGMRAPAGYADPDLQPAESQTGYLSPAALRRAGRRAATLGRVVTELKVWLQPALPTDAETASLLEKPALLRRLRLHGMARLAFDDRNVYLNGEEKSLVRNDKDAIAELCAARRLNTRILCKLETQCLRWLLTRGAFELPENI